MNRRLSTTFFSLTDFQSWLVSKRKSLDFVTGNKLTNAIELSKLNMDKIGPLQKNISEYLKESMSSTNPVA